MSNRNTIQDELRSLGSALPVTDSPSFSVPENYFDGLATAVLAKVKSSESADAVSELNELSPFLAGIPKTTPFSLPLSYFEENLQNIPVPNEEIELSLSAALGKTLPYEIPGNYFNDLPAQMLARISKQEGKVVPLYRRTWMRVAAAIVVTGGLVFGGLQIFGNKQQTGSDNLAAASTQKINGQLADNKAPIVQEIKKVSTKDLEEFIKTVPATATAPKKVSPSKTETKELLRDVSVNEMESFLAAIPQTEDELAATDEP